VGRILPHKGIDDLIKALPEGLTLEVIGRPYGEAYLRDLRAMADGKRVVFRHECTDDELVRAYRESMCIALPSVYRTMYGDETRVPELLGQTLLEGMACEAPAMCTDVASLPEVVQSGVTGFVVPPNNPRRSAQSCAGCANTKPKLARWRCGRRRVMETSVGRQSWIAV